MSLQFDNTVSLGNILVALVTVCGLAAGYAKIQADQTSQGRQIERLERSALDREARLRAVELMQASQTSDLRNIQVGIGRIEASLERLARGQ